MYCRTLYEEFGIKFHVSNILQQKQQQEYNQICNILQQRLLAACQKNHTINYLHIKTTTYITNIFKTIMSHVTSSYTKNPYNILTEIYILCTGKQ